MTICTCQVKKNLKIAIDIINSANTQVGPIEAMSFSNLTYRNLILSMLILIFSFPMSLKMKLGLKGDTIYHTIIKMSINSDNTIIKEL